MATQGSIGAQQRHEAILAVLAENGVVALEPLAEQLAVSAMTVRRDLEVLELEGALRRVRGGAVATAMPRSFGERQGVRTRAKQAIAAKAARLLPRSGAVAFDASSTTGTIASLLRGHGKITIATNSYENFLALSSVPEVTPILVGGEIEANTGSFVGPIACSAAGSLLYQYFFLSASAVDPTQGTSEVSLAEFEVKRAFAGRSRKNVLCVDSSKLGQLSAAAGFSLAEIDTMVTELPPDHPKLARFQGLVKLL